jgi:hypothetical protein
LHPLLAPKDYNMLKTHSQSYPSSTTFLFYLLYTLNFFSSNLTFLTARQLKTNYWGASQLKTPTTNFRRSLKWDNGLTPVTRDSKLTIKGKLTQPLFRLFSVFVRLSITSNSFFLNPHHTARLIFNLNTRTRLASLNSTTLFHR